MNSVQYRAMKFGIDRVEVIERDGEGVYLQAQQALSPYPNTITERFIHWCQQRPEKTLFAQRCVLDNGELGDWVNVSYEEALETAQQLGQALLNRNLSADRPVLILSENSLEHALLALACIYVGVPYCPASPAYSTLSKSHDKLHHIVKTITPGLVFARAPPRCGSSESASSTRTAAGWARCHPGFRQSMAVQPGRR